MLEVIPAVEVVPVVEAVEVSSWDEAIEFQHWYGVADCDTDREGQEMSWNHLRSRDLWKNRERLCDLHDINTAARAMEKSHT